MRLTPCLMKKQNSGAGKRISSLDNSRKKIKTASHTPENINFLEHHNKLQGFVPTFVPKRLNKNVKLLTEVALKQIRAKSIQNKCEKLHEIFINSQTQNFKGFKGRKITKDIKYTNYITSKTQECTLEIPSRQNLLKEFQKKMEKSSHNRGQSQNKDPLSLQSEYQSDKQNPILHQNFMVTLHKKNVKAKKWSDLKKGRKNLIQDEHNFLINSKRRNRNENMIHFKNEKIRKIHEKYDKKNQQIQQQNPYIEYVLEEQQLNKILQ